MVDVAVSEASRQKAAAAKSYIENMYKVHAQKHQDRRERCMAVDVPAACSGRCTGSSGTGVQLNIAGILFLPPMAQSQPDGATDAPILVFE